MRVSTGLFGVGAAFAGRAEFFACNFSRLAVPIVAALAEVKVSGSRCKGFQDYTSEIKLTQVGPC